jgi:hypothetical protein
MRVLLIWFLRRYPIIKRLSQMVLSIVICLDSVLFVQKIQDILFSIDKEASLTVIPKLHAA